MRYIISYTCTPLTHTCCMHSWQILLFDFVNEMYVWIGRQSAPAMRRKAVALGKKMFGAGCRPPVFNVRSSPARQSGRYRPRSSTTKSPRHSILNASGRRNSRGTKSDIKPRPEWALFARQERERGRRERLGGGGCPGGGGRE